MITNFEDKVIPSFNERDGMKTQGEFCDNAKCNEENIDCDTCLFSCTFCKVEKFNRWLEDYNKNKKQEEDE